MNIPKLRFPEFEGEWAIASIRSFTISLNAGVSVNSLDKKVKAEEVGVLKTSCISNGAFNSTENKIVIEEDISRVKETVERNTILVSRMNTPQLVGEIAYVDNNYPNLYLPDRLWKLELNEGITNTKWLSYCLLTPKNSALIKAQGSGTSGSMKNIAKPDFLNLEVYLPSILEQKKLADLFSFIDKKIKLQQEKIDLLKEQKKGFMQKIFNQELRFKGFNEDWKECNLGDLVDIVTGKLDANAMVENGKYDFYTSGIKKYKINIPAFEGPAITIAGNGATVGYMHYADGLFNAYQRTYVLSKFAVNRDFLFHYIGFKLPKKIQQEARTGNIPYIVMDMLTELGIKLPSDNEQEKIGGLFIKLDKLIKLNEEKINLLQEQKKSFMQKMFI